MSIKRIDNSTKNKGRISSIVRKISLLCPDVVHTGLSFMFLVYYSRPSFFIGNDENGVN